MPTKKKQVVQAKPVQPQSSNESKKYVTETETETESAMSDIGGALGVRSF